MGNKNISDPIIKQDKKFIKIYNQCKKYTMTSSERMYALYKSILYIIDNNIQGDFIECGVWKGGSSMLIACTLIELQITDRKLYLYDTFGGMSKPTENDYRVSGDQKPVIDRWKNIKKEDHNAWCYSSLKDVKNNMKQTKYPEKNIIYVKGKIENTLLKTKPDKIALLRLDTDWYESTRDELLYLYPLLSLNGILIIDDYGHWNGAKKAVDEYFSNNEILLNRIDYTGRIGIKIKEL